MLLTHALALSADQFSYARKGPYEYVHSVRIELAKLILVGTRITYKATGDAGCLLRMLYAIQYNRRPPSIKNVIMNSIGHRSWARRGLFWPYVMVSPS